MPTPKTRYYDPSPLPPGVMSYTYTQDLEICSYHPLSLPPEVMASLFLLDSLVNSTNPYRLTSGCHNVSIAGLQAVADAQGAEQMQIDWLKSEMGPHFTQKLLRCTRDILKWIGAHDSDSKHQFPILAGSHLSEVRPSAESDVSPPSRTEPGTQQSKHV